MTDVTDMQIVPAVLPIQMGANGVMTRNAFRQIATVVWSVFMGKWCCSYNTLLLYDH